MKVYKVWLEWDFGQDNKVFASEESAKTWIQREVIDDEYVGESFQTIEQLFESGLASIKSVEVI